MRVWGSISHTYRLLPWHEPGQPSGPASWSSKAVPAAAELVVRQGDDQQTKAWLVCQPTCRTRRPRDTRTVPGNASIPIGNLCAPASTPERIPYDSQQQTYEAGIGWRAIGFSKRRDRSSSMFFNVLLLWSGLFLSRSGAFGFW
jgi:hypothetical protein